MKKTLLISLVIVVVAGLIFSSCATPTPAPTLSPTPSPTPIPTPTPTPYPTSSPSPTTKAKPIELNFVTYMAENLPEHTLLFKPLFIDRVNERAKGELVIRDRGGPDIVNANDIIGAVKNGVFDMSNVGTGFFGSAVPGSDCTRLSEVIERDVPGCFEFIQSLYQKEGIYYLGRTHIIGEPFLYIFLRAPITNVQELTGRRVVGASAVYNSFYRALGLTPLNLPLGDYYTALERGVADAGASSTFIWFGSGLTEKAPYFIDHGWSRQPGTVVFNMNKWNQIPPHLQKLLNDVQLEMEKEWWVKRDQIEAGLKKQAEGKGAKFIKLPPTEADTYLKTFYKTCWEFDYARYPKDIVSTLEKMIRKTY